MIGTKILLLEDDYLYKNTIKDLLETQNYIVKTSSDGKSFLNNIYNNIYDLYIIDINVPIVNGFEILNLLKEYDDSTMKLVLTSSPDFLKKAFKKGCDDFLAKNSTIDELLLRIRSLIHRNYHCHNDIIQINEDISYNLFYKQLYKSNEFVDLEEHSLLVLDYLIKKRGVYVSNQELEKNIYPINSTSKSNVLRYHIYNLRKIIGKDLIKSKKSVGYMLEPLDE